MPKNPNRSIRASQAFWDQLDAYAAANKTRPGPAFVKLAEEAMSFTRSGASVDRTLKVRTQADPKAVLRDAEASAAHLATPKPRVSAKQREWRSALKSVPVGPAHSVPGSRLKGNATKPKR